MAKERYAYYHRSARDFFTFTAPKGQRVLIAGDNCAEDLAALAPSRGVLVVPAGTPVPETPYECHEGFGLEDVEGEFDYIILKYALNAAEDISGFASLLRHHCNADTRIIVHCHNYLWSPILKIAASLGFMESTGLKVMLSPADVNNVMTASGYQHVSSWFAMLFPIFCLGLGPILNLIGRLLPFLDWAKIDQFLIYRQLNDEPPVEGESLTVCITSRDERENIQPLVEAIPTLTENQEILFVEGHSTDGTREEIERMIELYPEKNIRVMGQPGIGQGDATRVGFHDAKGSIIIILESDMTSPPESLSYVYESMRVRAVEFIEGTRFVYPMPHSAMPFFNQMGNWFFAAYFSMLLRQQLTDVLCGIKAIRKSDFEKILSRWDSWGIEDPFGDFELLFGAIRLGLKTGEHPIRYYPRPYGEPKTRVFHHGKILVQMAIHGFARFRR